MSPGGKSLTDASPQEIFEADGLFTDSLFSVEKIIKGEDKEVVIRVRSFIGETAHVRWVDNTQPYYKQEQSYFLFLKRDNGPAAQVEPGYYKAVNALQGVYEIVDSKAISKTDEWVLEELIAHIQKSLSNETPLSVLTLTPAEETPTPSPTPSPTEMLIETATSSPTPADSPTQTPPSVETVISTP
jgi:hypothetical protein